MKRLILALAIASLSLASCRSDDSQMAVNDPSQPNAKPAACEGMSKEECKDKMAECPEMKKACCEKMKAEAAKP